MSDGQIDGRRVVLAACEMVAEQMHTSPWDALRRERHPKTVRARDLALWLIRACTDWSTPHMGRVLAQAGGWEMHWTSIGAACRRAERDISKSERVDLARELAAKLESRESV